MKPIEVKNKKSVFLLLVKIKEMIDNNLARHIKKKYLFSITHI